jgi:eukaryotic-like serine/threonine-protein kinase
LLVLWIAKQRPKLLVDDLELALKLKLVGECQIMQKKHAHAENVLRESLAVYLKSKPQDFFRYDNESLLGAALTGQKKYAEAEPLLINSAKVLVPNAAKLSPSHRQLILPTVQRVIDLYDAWDRPEDAARWRKVLETLKAK